MERKSTGFCPHTTPPCKGSVFISHLLRRVYTMRQKHATMRHATCVKFALCKWAYCDMRLSQESWMISTFLRQHATVACRTNKPVYTARFCQTSHIASVLSHRVNAPLGIVFKAVLLKWRFYTISIRYHVNATAFGKLFVTSEFLEHLWEVHFLFF